MSPELEAFLAAEDLDELLNARQEIAVLDAEDEAVVRSVLEHWRNVQAISNLLFHPTLIPEDVRLASLFRGLAERRVVYFVLASVVGFQDIRPDQLSAEDRRRVTSDLLAVIRETDNIVAQRASVSFQGFAGESDAPQVFALLEHPDKTVRHNLRAWLFSTFKDQGVEAFNATARGSGLTEQAKRQVIAEFAEFMTGPPEGSKNLVFPLYGYIPNLRDVGESN
jgi:hypothetical protein